MLSLLLATRPKCSAFQSTDDFAAADAEKTAEIDHRRAHRAGAIDDHVDDPPHVLVCRAADLAAEHAMRIAARR